MQQTRLMVIAGGPWQVALIRKAKAMGLFVINSNLFPDSPGFRYADVGLVADVRDKKKNLAFARQYQPDGIVTDQTDLSVPTVAYLCEELGLPGIGLTKAELFTNKYQMRQFLRQRGYPTPEYRLCQSPADAADLAAKFGYPIVLKPPANQGGRGVLVVSTDSELPSRYAEAFRWSHDEHVLAEQFLSGPELTVEGFKTSDRHYSLAVSRKKRFAHNPMVASELIYSPAAEDLDFEALKQQHNTMVEEMGLRFGITHAEYIFSQGRFVLVEVAARGGGNNVSSEIVPAISGINVNELLVRMSLGETVDSLAPCANGVSFVGLSFFNFEPGIVRAVCGVETVRTLPGVRDISISVRCGQRLEPASDDPHGTDISLPRQDQLKNFNHCAVGFTRRCAWPMHDIPLFDSLTHPTLDGTWIGSAPCKNTLPEVESEMAANNVEWALAVGMKDIGGYALEAYADYIRSASQKVFPIAYYDFNESDTGREIARKLENISRCGYLGIKVHPGFSRIDLRSQGLRQVLGEAGSRKLPVLLCTFLHRQTPNAMPCSYLDFGPLLASLPQTSKIILIHGGDVNLLALMEISRPYRNVLLDLSFTLCRYEGSSVDMDIRYLLRQYDQRICVGSDNPQFSLAQFRRRFDELAAGVDREKSINAAHRNLQSFIGTA